MNTFATELLPLALLIASAVSWGLAPRASWQLASLFFALVALVLTGWQVDWFLRPWLTRFGIFAILVALCWGLARWLRWWALLVIPLALFGSWLALNRIGLGSWVSIAYLSLATFLALVIDP